ncbi:MAG: ComEC family competence protein, partial [Chlorobiales bacterium]|nr:ComEC family competence protein [Chlorobiales bacterium]
MTTHPALRLLVFVVIGILLGTYVPGIEEYAFYLSMIFGGITLAAVLYDYVLNQKYVSTVWTLGYKLFVVSFFAFYSSQEAGKIPDDTVLQYANESVELYGTVESKPVIKGNRAQWTMDAKKVVRNDDTAFVSGKVSVKLSGTNDFKLSFTQGDNVWITGKLQLPPIARNKGEFNYREFLAQRKTYVILTSFGEWSVEKVANEDAGFFQSHIIRPTYQYLEQTIDALISGEDERAFLNGVIIGNQASITDEVKAAFQTTGTIHVLSISGFHIALLVILLNGLLKRVKLTTIGRWAAFILTAIVLVVYSYVTGNFPPVKRAVIMALVFSGSELFEKKSYPLNTLAVSALIIVT